MDDERFDAFAKALVAPGTRRRALAGLLGGAAAALAGGRAAAHHGPAHCAEEGQRLTPSKACCPGLVADGDGRCRAACPAPSCCCNCVSDVPDPATPGNVTRTIVFCGTGFTTREACAAHCASLGIAGSVGTGFGCAPPGTAFSCGRPGCTFGYPAPGTPADCGCVLRTCPA